MKRMCSLLLLAAVCFAPSIIKAADAEQGTVKDVANDIAVKPEDAIASALRTRVSVDFQERPFRDVIEQLQKDLKIPILVDMKGIEDQGLSSDLPLTLKVSGVSARSVLNLLLRPLQLDWTIRDEVVWIGPRESLSPETKVYNVSSLVGANAQEGEPSRNLTALVELISSTIEPESWAAMGGQASIQPCETLGVRAIVVRQFRSEHDAIETLLDELKKCQKE